MSSDPQAAQPPTDADLDAIVQRARALGSPNCWTGTGGTVAADAFRLVLEVRRLRADRPSTGAADGYDSVNTGGAT